VLRPVVGRQKILQHLEVVVERSDGRTAGGPVVKTRVCTGIAGDTLARVVLQVSSSDRRRHGGM
jgi:hypothetical protein